MLGEALGRALDVRPAHDTVEIDDVPGSGERCVVEGRLLAL
jgi:hypothetical protein